MMIAHETIIGEDGQPRAAIIPWNVFIQLQEIIEDEQPTAEELAAIREAEADRKAGNKDAFVRLADLKKELSL